MNHGSKIFQNKVWMMTLILLITVLCSLNLALASEHLVSNQEDIPEGNTPETISRTPVAAHLPDNGSNPHDPNPSPVEKPEEPVEKPEEDE